MDKPVFRFAPSPNGHLHLGHAYSALLNQKMARDTKSKLLLRIEDIDTQRCTPELEAQMLRDLEWIGFEWDEAPRRQSEHFDEYREALNKLTDLDLLYPSAMSRGDIKKAVAAKRAQGIIWPNDPDGVALYPGLEREFNNDERLALMSSHTDYALRLNMKNAVAHADSELFWLETGQNINTQINAKPLAWGDVIMARKNIPVSYLLSCTYDDAIQNITHIVRGQDLYHSTSIHLLLLKIWGFEQPTYHHHELILNQNSEKLSKSKKHPSLKDLRASGISVSQIKSDLGFI